MTGKSRDEVYLLLKSENAIDVNNNMIIKRFADALNKDIMPLKPETNMTDNQIRSILDNNLNTDARTEIRFDGHSTMISGVRYDSEGNITNYLMNDPGRKTNTTINRTTLTNPEWGKIQKTRWLENKNK